MHKSPDLNMEEAHLLEQDQWVARALSRVYVAILTVVTLDNFTLIAWPTSRR